MHPWRSPLFDVQHLRGCELVQTKNENAPNGPRSLVSLAQLGFVGAAWFRWRNLVSLAQRGFRWRSLVSQLDFVGAAGFRWRNLVSLAQLGVETKMMGGPLQVWVSGSKQEVGSCSKAAFRNVRGGASRSSIEGTRGAVRL